MQLNSRQRRDQGPGAHSSHDVIPITLDDPNHNTRPTIRIADARRHQASPVATRMLMNTDSARTSHSALQHLAADGRTAPELQAKSRHLHLGSLGRYVQLGEQTSAQVTADADPAARRKTR